MLKKIAGGKLTKNPAWKVSVEEDTDNTGGAAPNLDRYLRNMNLLKGDAMMRVFRPMLVGSLFLGACGGGASSAQTDAQKVAAALTGDDKQAAADNPQCKLFTRAEAAKYIGEPVSAGQNAMGGCQWVANGGSGNVMVIVVPARYHERPTLADGFKEEPEVGTKGFVARDMGGWVAGAIVGTEAVRVVVAGATASQASAIALLKESIKRHAS